MNLTTLALHYPIGLKFLVAAVGLHEDRIGLDRISWDLPA